MIGMTAMAQPQNEGNPMDGMTDETDWFAEEDEVTAGSQAASQAWKILIVDDDQEVHTVTRLILRDARHAGAPLELISAYSGSEAIEVLKEHPDVAVIFLDVVMESDDAGLKAVKRIREELANVNVRIILRTGQPGMAPERTVIDAYDINDYKAKSELTADKLFTAVTTALRSYRHIQTIEMNRIGLEKIIEASATMQQKRSVRQFAEGVMIQLKSLIGTAQSLILCTHGSDRGGEAAQVVAAAGELVRQDATTISDLLPADQVQQVEQAIREQRALVTDRVFVAVSRSRRSSASVVVLSNDQELPEVPRRLLEIFCHKIVVAFDNIYLYEQLLKAQAATVQALGQLAEYKDETTGEHVRRVQHLVDAVAREAFARGLFPTELDEEVVELIGLASILHDVGKVAVPDAILRKPGKLDTEELKVMQQHAEIGGRILREAAALVDGVSYLTLGSTIADSHHEKIDGTGYPAGLKGDTIPVVGKITAVVDVYDALTHERPYKPAWPVNEAIAFITKNTGNHFDPVVVEVFLDVLRATGKIDVAAA